MITKYRYTLGSSIIETLDINSIPENTAYDTIIISDEEIQAQETENLQLQKAEIAKQNQIALAQKLALDAVVNQQQTLPDADALELQAIYPLWDGNGKSYILNEKCQDFDNNNELKLWKCVQPIVSQPQFPPRIIPAHFVIVAPVGVIPDWVEPINAQTAYNIGDKVKYNGQTWISKINGNTTVPDGDVPFNRYWEPVI